MTARSSAADLAAALLGIDLEGAACAGASVEFVDPSPMDVDVLIRDYCHRCPVAGRCREFGDSLAPFKHGVIYGARWYQASEPVDGFEVAS